MWDWFTGRKPIDEPLLLSRQGFDQRAIEQALASVDLRVSPQPDATQFCIKAAANVARAVAARAHFSLDDLDEGSKLVTALFGLVAGDRFSASLNASFSVVASVIPVDLFGGDYAAEFPRLERAYRRLGERSEVLKAISGNISEWVLAPSDQRIERLAAAFVICRRHV
ncbi:MAG TPA: hypothetical protein VKV96_20860 [Roseiarcus sp.]|nr:hypothetical protein [Roseiarcus sp.]